MAGRAPERRQKDSADARERLVQAAIELFARADYDRVTTRAIGDRAGVDPALIARYFGNKSSLYLESLRRRKPSERIRPLDLGNAADLAQMLQHVGKHHPTPSMYAAVRPHDDSRLQSAAMDTLRRLVSDHAEATARDSGLDQPELRAQIATAALAGVVISRTSKALPQLGRASIDDVARLLAILFRDFVDAGEAAPSQSD